VYYETYGDPRGTPAVFLHGGPGAGCYPNHARFFDLSRYHVVLLDQRGCGRSEPRGCLLGNHTGALADDLELLRRHLALGPWVVLGGSWGSALALAYAQRHPGGTLGLLLRGVCLMRPRELEWMFRRGASALRPEGWQRFLSQLAPEEQGDPLPAFYARLLSDDASVRDTAVRGLAPRTCALPLRCLALPCLARRCRRRPPHGPVHHGMVHGASPASRGR
jgi:proline iminopeptidase